MTLFSRRRFLQLGAIATGSAFVAARSLGWPQINWLNPQTGQPLPKLAVLPTQRPEPGLVTAQINATPAIVNIGGVSSRLLTYNGSYPGKLLKVREGERVQVKFTNELEEHTNLHLHGVHIGPVSDDPFWHGHPGWSKIYEFDAPTGSANTAWYHPHPHGAVAHQTFSGMAGAVVVTGPLDDLPELQAAEEHVLVLKDISLDGAKPPDHNFFEVGGKLGQLSLVNGAWQPVLKAQKATLRLRLINASNARIFDLSLDGHAMHLIATDGGFIEQPVSLKQLQLAPGERADVLVQLDRPDRLELRDKDSLLMTIVPPARLEPTALPGKLARLARLDLSKVAVTRKVVFDFAPPYGYGINGQMFQANRIDFEAKMGNLEIWEIYNAHHQDHPFHLHSYPFQVLDRNGVAEPFAAWRDTVNVREKETVRLAVPIRDYAGRTVFHCHIAEHEDSGMMGVLEVAA